MKRKSIIISMILLTIFAFSSILFIKETFVSVLSNTFEQNNSYVLIIDAGHGGEDGGAISANGTIESGINLNIALKLGQLCDFIGRDYVLTRLTDKSLAENDARSIREKKVSDLKQRVALANSFDKRILISIHQNSLPGSPKVYGAQAFYNHIENSAKIAGNIQNELNNTVNISNKKLCKQIDSTIYLMKNVTCEAVLVECGFLSNSAETELLCSDGYQRKLALAILVGAISEDKG